MYLHLEKGLISFQTLEPSSVHKWRNDLIDAAVLRVLKKAAMGNDAGAALLSLEALYVGVKTALHQRLLVTTQDIVKRTEHLLSAGIIEKSRLSSKGLNSVGYSYLPVNIVNINTSSNTDVNTDVRVVDDNTKTVDETLDSTKSDDKTPFDDKVARTVGSTAIEDTVALTTFDEYDAYLDSLGADFLALSKQIEMDTLELNNSGKIR